MHEHLPAGLYCAVDELCCSLGLFNHLLANLVVEVEVNVLVAFRLEVVFELEGSVHHVGHSVALKQLLPAHARVLVSQQQAFCNDCRVETEMALHFVPLDPVSAPLALLADLKVPELLLSGYVSTIVLDYDSCDDFSASSSCFLHFASTSSLDETELSKTY